MSLWTQLGTYIVLFVALILCICILCVDTVQIHIKNIPIDNTYQKWLKRLSVLCMLSCIIRLIFLVSFEIPTICKYFNPKFSPISHTTIKIIFGFYQICRLHYCFNKDYRKCIFIILYLNGCLLIILSYVTNLSNMRIIANPQTNQCVAKFDDSLSGIYTSWYYIWSIIVIVMFAVKLKQIQKQSVINDWNKRITHKKVNLLLHKILILTIFSETITIICFVFFTIALRLSNEIYEQLVIAIFSAVDISLTCFIMFLMVERNRNIYKTLITFIADIHLCCCCKRFVYQTIPSDIHDEQTATKQSSQTTTNSNMTTSVTSIAGATIDHNTVTKMEEHNDLAVPITE
eukprot:444052_1